MNFGLKLMVSEIFEVHSALVWLLKVGLTITARTNMKSDDFIWAGLRVEHLLSLAISSTSAFVTLST